MDTEPEILRYGQVSATRIQRYGVRDKDTFRQEFGDSWYRGWMRQVQPHRGRNLKCLQHGSRGSLVVGIEEKG
jgi:hypothetical protein